MVWVNILHIGDIDTLTRSLIVLFSQKKSLHGTLKDIPVRYLGPLPARSPGDSVAWPDSASSAADDPSPSTLEAFDGLSPNSGHAKTINVHPGWRIIYCEFRFSGSVSFVVCAF